MTVRVYTYLDASAPVLNGTAGSVIALLKACLVTGYGAQAAAGWTEEFTGTNLSVLRPAAGNRFYYRLDDSAAEYATIKGYVAMTGVSTGTEPFPTSSTVLHIQKSSTADATARQWMVVADEKTVHFAHQWNGAANWEEGRFYSFGDFVKANAAWPAINSYIWANNSGETTGQNATTYGLNAGFTSTTSGLQRSRNVDGTQTTLTCRRAPEVQYAEGSISSYHGYHGRADPSLATGGYITSRILVFSTQAPVTYGEAYNLLGRFRGLRDILHTYPLAVFDTVNGAGDLAGKTFIATRGGWPAVSAYGQLLIETSNTWEA